MNPDLWTALATAVAVAILLVRMLTLGGNRGLSGLVFYLGQHLLWGVAFVLIPRKSHLYVAMYELSNPVEWLAAAWCTVDLLGKAFDAYPGIRSLSRRAASGAIVAATAITLTIARYFWSGSMRGQRRLFYFEVADRTVLLSLALVVILTLGFLSRFPLPLQSNTWASLIGFSAVVLSLAGARLMDSLAPHLAALPVDRAQLLFETLCYVVWAASLQKAESQAPARVIFHHAGEQELLRQLEAMNGILRGAGRS